MKYAEISRRTSLGLLGGLAAAPLVPGLRVLGARAAAAHPTPVRMDFAVFVQDAARLGSLWDSIAAMRARPPSDPKSWFFQAAVHGVTQAAVDEALAADPEVANVDQARFWNQCPHFGQASANFLPWHRAYLHYFERILRDAAGNRDLALPYWNYLEPSQRTFPRPFSDEFLADGVTLNPLFHPSRDLGFALGVFQLTDPVVSVAAPFTETRFFGPTEEEGFAGGIGDSDAGTQGLIERGVHNLVHFAVGGRVDDAVGAMGRVPTAAFDPIFWVHHATIDKLWVEWMCGAGREWGSLPDDAWFDETPWAFYDETGTVQTPSRRSMLDHAALGYAYDTDDPACMPLALPATSPVASASAEPADAEASEIARIETSAEIGTEPLAVQLEGVDLAPSPAAANEGELVVEVSGIRIVEAPLQGYDVYLLDDAEAPADRGSPGYLGTLALFGLDHAAPGHDLAEQGSTQRFRAGDAATSLEDPASAVVVLRPFDLLSPVESPTADASSEIVARRAENLGSIAVSAIRILRD